MSRGPLRSRPGGAAAPPSEPRLGLSANAGQFLLLVGVNALVGGMVGQERTVLPLLAGRVFGLTELSAVLVFLVAFGVVKAAANLAAGALADRFGRKRVLVSGWLVGVPVPLLLLWAPTWGWVVFANVLLGVNQGLCWSSTVVMKVDLVGPRGRGLATGLNEAAGYGSVAVTALVTGYLAQRFGLRPAPFLLGLSYAGLGLAASVLLVRETAGHARVEERAADAAPALAPGSLRRVFVRTSVREPALSASCQAGLVNNLNDGLAWGLLPLFFARHGLSVGTVGVLVALYPAVWAVAQLGTGVLSDAIGRKWLIVAGMWVQGGALALIAGTRGFTPWAAGAVLQGLGTAMVYPTLLAAVTDVAGAGWRASALGVYRFWRDLGFAVGGLLVGAVADAWGLVTPIWVVAGLTVVSGGVVAIRMYETRRR